VETLRDHDLGNNALWISQETLSSWTPEKDPEHFGRPFLYSEDLIKAALITKSVFRLTYRALQGFLTSVMELANQKLPIPSYSQMCKRSRRLKLPSKLPRKRPQHLVFDSSGLKVYGEGEWHVKKHGMNKRRRWLKVHVGICPETHEIILAETTNDATHDSSPFPSMIERAPKGVKHVYGDGAYDTRGCYAALRQKAINSHIPPRQNAILHASDQDFESRNEAICIIAALGGDDLARSIWKKLTGYGRRSLAETCFSRLKGLFGERLSSRDPARQRNEILLRCLALNEMTRQGMPRSYAI
jgi:Transposase DDE domain